VQAPAAHVEQAYSRPVGGWGIGVGYFEGGCLSCEVVHFGGGRHGRSDGYGEGWCRAAPVKPKGGFPTPLDPDGHPHRLPGKEDNARQTRRRHAGRRAERATHTSGSTSRRAPVVGDVERVRIDEVPAGTHIAFAILTSLRESIWGARGLSEIYRIRA
jgi:hypothetical protein